MGPVGQKNLIGHFPDPFLIDLLYMSLLPLYLSPRCQRNTLYTKTRDFGMQISYSPISGILTMHFSPLGIP